MGGWIRVLENRTSLQTGMKGPHDADFGPDGTPTPERGVAMLGGFSLARGCGVAQVLMRGHAAANHSSGYE